MLLTYDTFEHREHYLNARNTFEELLRRGVTPIVNENDTVAVQELRVGDNDTLAAMVAAMVTAQTLCILTDVESLFTMDPGRDPTARRVVTVRSGQIPQIRRKLRESLPLAVDELGASLEEESSALSDGDALAGDGADASAAAAASSSSTTSAASSSTSASAGRSGAWGTGGMNTKLTAAQIATACGCETRIFSTRRVPSLCSLLLGEVDFGTRFLANPKPMKGQKKWVASLVPQGRLVLDAGAVRAVVEARKSLFAAGIREVHGDFDVNVRSMLASASTVGSRALSLHTTRSSPLSLWFPRAGCGVAVQPGGRGGGARPRELRRGRLPEDRRSPHAGRERSARVRRTRVRRQSR